MAGTRVSSRTRNSRWSCSRASATKTTTKGRAASRKRFTLHLGRSKCESRLPRLRALSYDPLQLSARGRRYMLSKLREHRRRSNPARRKEHGPTRRSSGRLRLRKSLDSRRLPHRSRRVRRRQQQPRRREFANLPRLVLVRHALYRRLPLRPRRRVRQRPPPLRYRARRACARSLRAHHSGAVLECCAKRRRFSLSGAVVRLDHRRPRGATARARWRAALRRSRRRRFRQCWRPVRTPPQSSRRRRARHCLLPWRKRPNRLGALWRPFRPHCVRRVR